MKHLLIFSILLLGCSKQDENSCLFSYSITNNTDFDLKFMYILKSSGLICEPDSFIVHKRMKVQINSDNSPGLYKITPLQKTNLSFEAKEGQPDNWTIISYQYYAMYTISGTAKKVLATWTGSKNTKGQEYLNIPDTIGFKTSDNFDGDFFYISAQNQNESGSVIVKIYLREKLLKTAQVNCAYCIATASY